MKKLQHCYFIELLLQACRRSTKIATCYVQGDIRLVATTCNKSDEVVNLVTATHTDILYILFSSYSEHFGNARDMSGQVSKRLTLTRARQHVIASCSRNRTSKALELCDKRLWYQTCRHLAKGMHTWNSTLITDTHVFSNIFLLLHF